LAVSLISTDVNILEKSMYGYNGYSLDDFADGAKPAVTGYLEDAGALYFANAEDPDGTAAFAAIGASTIFYGFLNPATLTLYVDTTTPAWSDDKNGYYHSVSATHRCYFRGFKDASGNWDQKTIIINKNIGVNDEGVSIGINASDNKIYYDTDKELLVSDPIYVAPTYTSGGSVQVQNTIFDELDPYIKNTNEKIFVNGGGYEGTSYIHTFSYAERTDTSTIKLHSLTHKIGGNPSFTTHNISDGSTSYITGAAGVAIWATLAF
jgi:hypothetical protein